MTQATGDTLTTIVFVDVQGSTGLVDLLGDAAGTRAVLRQLDVVRERLPSYGGHEVKSLGDCLLLTFSSPRQAVAFGVACQRALGDSAPRVRIGVNTGEVIDLDDDPIGGAVNAAARIAEGPRHHEATPRPAPSRQRPGKPDRRDIMITKALAMITNQIPATARASTSTTERRGKVLLPAIPARPIGSGLLVSV